MGQDTEFYEATTYRQSRLVLTRIVYQPMFFEAVNTVLFRTIGPLVVGADGQLAGRQLPNGFRLSESSAGSCWSRSRIAYQYFRR